MNVIAFGHNLDSAPYLDIKFLDFQCSQCLYQLKKLDRFPNSLHLHCPSCSESGIIERSTTIAAECLRNGIQQDESPIRTNRVPNRPPQ